MEQLRQLAASLAFLDVVAAGEGRGGEYVTDELRKEASDRAAYVVPYIEAAAAAAAGAWLASKLPNVQLDSDDPFSDASLSGALSQILGVNVASVRDRESLKAAFRAAVTVRVSQELGYQFTDVFDKAALRLDVLRWLGQHLSSVIPGLTLRDLSSREIVLQDIEEYGTRVLSSATGINFTNIRSRQAIKEDVYAFVLPVIEQQLEAEGQHEYRAPLKMDVKSIRRREAVRRFRARWGARETYQGVNGG